MCYFYLYYTKCSNFNTQGKTLKDFSFLNICDQILLFFQHCPQQSTRLRSMWSFSISHLMFPPSKAWKFITECTDIPVIYLPCHLSEGTWPSCAVKLSYSAPRHVEPLMNHSVFILVRCLKWTCFWFLLGSFCRLQQICM